MKTDLDELERLEKGALRGPWRHLPFDTEILGAQLTTAILSVSENEYVVGGECPHSADPEHDDDGCFSISDRDAALVVALHNAAPELIAELRRLRAAIERAQDDESFSDNALQKLNLWTSEWYVRE